MLGGWGLVYRGGGDEGFSRVVFTVELFLSFLELLLVNGVNLLCDILECDKFFCELSLLNGLFLELTQMVVVAVDLLGIKLVQKL